MQLSTRGTVVSDIWLMRLAEKLVPRSYHPLDNDWTPLSQNPCWTGTLSTASNVTWKEIGFGPTSYENTRASTACVSIVISNIGSDTSFADDLVASRYCKYLSRHCLTIYWDLACVFRCVFWHQVKKGGPVKQKKCPRTKKHKYKSISSTVG